MSFLTQSHQVFYGRPLCLIPSTSYVMQCLTQSLSSFRLTCKNHINLLFLIIKLTGSNPKSSSLFCLSFSLTPHIHLTILNAEGTVVNNLLQWVNDVQGNIHKWHWYHPFVLTTLTSHLTHNPQIKHSNFT